VEAAAAGFAQQNQPPPRELTPRSADTGHADPVTDESKITPPLVLRGAARRYGRRVVFENLDLTLGPGVTGILGPNGAGKSTLLECLATLVPPDGGELAVLGDPITGEGQARVARRRMGFMPQHFGYVRSLTVRETVAYAAWARLVDGNIDAAVGDALSQLRLSEESSRRMRTLSGGTVQRVGLACALVGQPEVLVLDEPTVGLDPAQRIVLRTALTAQPGTCVVLSTHNVDDVMATADRVIVFLAGRVVFDGTTDQLCDHDRGGSGSTPAERAYMALVGETA